MSKTKSLSILVFNAGSSSLKFDLFERQAADKLKSLVRGTISNIGSVAALDWSNGTAHARIFVEAKDHQRAAEWVLEWLEKLWPFGSLLESVGIVVHRVVHGGTQFHAPVIVTQKVLDQLHGLSHLAPLHNPKAMAVMQICHSKLASRVQSIAVFDTAFFNDLPKESYYALPKSLVEEYGIRRFGFHGIAHRYMMQRYLSLNPDTASNQRIISFQLGHGCSIAAIHDGKPVDTSMGFTPLEGLMMATRAGDIDPGILIYLLNNGHTVTELEKKLNNHSGLLGVAGTTADMRELLAWQDSDEDAKLAINMFCQRARKYLGAYLALLHGADVVLFGGGIGEHAAEIRQRICDNMDWCGLELDEQRNNLAIGTETRISSDTSKIGVYVIPVNEELMMAEDALSLVWSKD